MRFISSFNRYRLIFIQYRFAHLPVMKRQKSTLNQNHYSEGGSINTKKSKTETYISSFDSGNHSPSSPNSLNNDKDHDIDDHSLSKSKKDPLHNKNKEPPQRALVWFRQDLRTINNPALLEATIYTQKSSTKNGETIAIYFINETDWQRHNTSPAQVNLILRTLINLKESLKKKYKIPLIIQMLDASLSFSYDTSDRDFLKDEKIFCYQSKDAANTSHQKKANQVNSINRFVEHFLAICKQWNINALFYNQEYGVDERARDNAIQHRLTKEDLIVFSYEDQCLISPGNVLNKQGSPYRVFTPFKNVWIDTIISNFDQLVQQMQLPISNKDDPEIPQNETISHLFSTIKGFGLSPSLEKSIQTDWKDKEELILEKMRQFIQSPQLMNYKKNRDLPQLSNGTSKLSAYLSIGSLSVRSIVYEIAQLYPSLFRLKHTPQLGSTSKSISSIEGPSTYLSELCWRDFYRHILFYYPRVSKNLPFQLSTMGIPWRTGEEAKKDFEAWKSGQTGFPIVDAGMRQLSSSGWMHNRLRMIVASFLTKDLLIDWRAGETYFSQTLIDGDLASNNGGWQWSASTGTDAQPYFRIFNPKSQSEKFDPSGTFIRQWVPELHSLTDNTIHDPASLGAEKLKKIGYNKPIVDHSKAREDALSAFKSVI